MKRQTLQSIFTRVYRHFIINKSPKAFHDGACVYRGGYDAKSKLRCAVGLLIPNRLYDASFEGNNAPSLLSGNWANSPVTVILADKLSKYFRETFEDTELDALGDFLYELQCAHDGTTGDADFYVNLKTELLRIADTYKLKVPTK